MRMSTMKLLATITMRLVQNISTYGEPLVNQWTLQKL